MRAGGDAGRFWKEHEEEEEGRKMGKMRSLLAADGNGFGERSRSIQTLNATRARGAPLTFNLLLSPPSPFCLVSLLLNHHHPSAPPTNKCSSSSVSARSSGLRGTHQSRHRLLLLRRRCSFNGVPGRCSSAPSLVPAAPSRSG
ncbi:hypothetical protein FQA47_018935 [Oryzias melastigma]|uniref:Uncharacterized protein n=1 Tax=Oryzias melastigma TaxID=30732 RepID=A0A834BUK3_ORYME|nr:hypothetical protein FQA47_018935 [Oryzias melastigma]